MFLPVRASLLRGQNRPLTESEIHHRAQKLVVYASVYTDACVCDARALCNMMSGLTNTCSGVTPTSSCLLTRLIRLVQLRHLGPLALALEHAVHGTRRRSALVRFLRCVGTQTQGTRVRAPVISMCERQNELLAAQRSV